jgi:hypothetical protein
VVGKHPVPTGLPLWVMVKHVAFGSSQPASARHGVLQDADVNEFASGKQKPLEPQLLFRVHGSQ